MDQVTSTDKTPARASAPSSVTVRLWRLCLCVPRGWALVKVKGRTHVVSDKERVFEATCS